MFGVSCSPEITQRLVCVFLPSSREEVEKIGLISEPDKANAGGLVETHQGPNDGVKLLWICTEKEQDPSVQRFSIFTMIGFSSKFQLSASKSGAQYVNWTVRK